MPTHSPYSKLIKKIQEQLEELQAEIYTLPDVNLLTLPFVLARKIVSPNQIPSLQDKLEKLRAKAQSMLDTYVRPSINVTSDSFISNQDAEISEDFYFPQILELISKINILSTYLKNKDLQTISEKFSDSHYKNYIFQKDQVKSSGKLDHRDWSDLEL